LSLDEIERLSSSMGSLLWLAFSGGEVFLRDEIVDITKIFYERNRPSIILFSTNGILTDTIERDIEQIIRYCKKSRVVVKLSLDGPESSNDRIRGKGSFKKTMETYRRLKGFVKAYPNFELGINTVFCKANQDLMDELMDFVRSLDGIKTHTVSLIRGTVLNNELKDIDVERYHETITKMESDLRYKRANIYSFRGARLKVAQDILQRRYIYKTLVERRVLMPCYAGRLSIVLTEGGDVYPCESFQMRLGNVRDYEYNIKGLLKAVNSREMVSSINERGCYCTHECYLMINILFNPRMLPLLLQEYLRLM